MTSAAQTLADEAERIVPGGVNSATRRIGSPWAWRSAHGATITDLDGRSYTDYHAAFGAILLGHVDERVNDAVVRAVQQLDLVGLGTTELEVEAARLVIDAIPSAEVVISTMSGSESVFQALRLARGATGRPYILKFQGCFHGSYDAVARNVISAPDKAWGDDANSTGILPDALAHTLIAEFNDLASVEEHFAQHPVRTFSPLATNQSYSSRCCSGNGCSSSHTSAPRPDGRRRVRRSCAPYSSAMALNSSSCPMFWRVHTTEILNPVKPASFMFCMARIAVA